jgi:hypothetical protein
MLLHLAAFFAAAYPVIASEVRVMFGSCPIVFEGSRQNGIWKIQPSKYDLCTAALIQTGFGGQKTGDCVCGIVVGTLFLGMRLWECVCRNLIVHWLQTWILFDRQRQSTSNQQLRDKEIHRQGPILLCFFLFSAVCGAFRLRNS